MNSFLLKFSRLLLLSLLLLQVLVLAGCGKPQPEETVEAGPPRDQFDEAEGGAAELLAAHPDYAAAKAALDSDNPDEAERLLQQLLVEQAFNPVFANDLGIARLRMGDSQGALEAFALAVDKSPDYQRGWFNMGVLQARMGNAEAAETAYQQAIHINPFYYEALYNLGLLYYQAGRLTEAEQVFRSIADNTRSSRFNRVYYQLGLIASGNGDDAGAIKQYDESLLLDPSHVPSYLNKAAALLRLQMAGKARDVLDKAARLAPGDSRISWNIGLAWLAEGNDAEARRAFEKTLSLDSNYTPALVNLAAIAMRAGETAGARELLQQAIGQDPANPSAYWNRGLIFLQEDKREQAEADFETVIGLDPGFSPALFNLGLARYREGKWAEARELFHRAAYAKSGDPYPEAHYMLGKTHSEQGNYNAAINEYEIALKLKPDYHEAAYNLALNLSQSGDQTAANLVYRRLATSDNPPPEALNNLATWHLENNRAGQAVPLLERAVAIAPEYSTAHYNLGLARLRIEDLAGAAQAFSVTVELDPSHFAAWKNLGIAHARMERIEPALEAMRTAFDLDPQDADAAVYVVKYLKLLDRPESEITDVYRRSHETGARNPLMLRHLARAAFDAEDYGAAAVYYEDYIKLRPSPVYIYNLGLARLRNDQFPEAVEAFSEATRLDPGNFAYWKNLGIAWSRLDDHEQALQAMQRAFDLNPGDADTAVYVVKYLKLLNRPESSVTEFYQRAYATGARDILILRHLARDAFQQEDFDAAARYYREYVEIRPSATYWYNLGLALRKAGRFEEARDAYKETLNRDPRNEKAWLNLGYIHAFLNDPASAEAAFTRALEIDPDYENAHQALVELKNGSIKP